jgi:hypothetical protein
MENREAKVQRQRRDILIAEDRMENREAKIQRQRRDILIA